MNTRKCSKTGTCETMEARLNPSPGKGLRAVIVIDAKTMKERFIGVAYHTSKNDRGTLLNFCPWCGGSYSVDLHPMDNVG